MTKVQAQLCLLCNEELVFSKNTLLISVACSGHMVHHKKVTDCVFSNCSMPKELWNRIRIAPDDKKVYKWEECMDHQIVTLSKDWMNPRYPDGH